MARDAAWVVTEERLDCLKVTDGMSVANEGGAWRDCDNHFNPFLFRLMKSDQVSRKENTPDEINQQEARGISDSFVQRLVLIMEV